jgi:bacteriorhodopsin
MTIVMESTLMLTTGQYSLVYNMLSLTIAAMGAATVFFFLVRGSVLPKYRPALIVSGLVTLIACYHYFRIFNSWEGAYVLGAMGYGPSGQPFNDAYRYVDWLLTVPLLLVELVAVLALPVKLTRSLLTRLIIAAVIRSAPGTRVKFRPIPAPAGLGGRSAWFPSSTFNMSCGSNSPVLSTANRQVLAD